MEFTQILKQAHGFLNDIEEQKAVRDDIYKIISDAESSRDVSIEIVSRHAMIHIKIPYPYPVIQLIRNHAIDNIEAAEKCIQDLAQQLTDPSVVENHYASITAELARVKALNSTLIETIRQSQSSPATS